MAYVNVPKDLSKVKSKVMLNLTKRQLLCIGGGALVGVPLFFLLKELRGKIAPDKMKMPSFLMVLTGIGSYAYRRSDGVYVVPIGCLKS